MLRHSRRALRLSASSRSRPRRGAGSYDKSDAGRYGERIAGRFAKGNVAIVTAWSVCAKSSIQAACTIGRLRAAAFCTLGRIGFVELMPRALFADVFLPRFGVGLGRRWQAVDDR